MPREAASTASARRRNLTDSIHVVRWIHSKNILRRDQRVLRNGTRRHALAAQHFKRQRQHLVAVAVHVIGYRPEYYAATVARIELLAVAGASMDAAVHTLTYYNAIADPTGELD